MDTAKARLTVLFDPPFWVGLFERESGGRYEACKHTFGAEPRDAEVYALVLEQYHRLAFSPALEAAPGEDRSVSPKRAQRLARRQTQPAGIGTKAQQALQLQREGQKTARKAAVKQRREEQRERKLTLRQEKRRQKHKGH